MTVSSLPSREVPSSLCPPEVKSTSFQNWLSLWGLAFPYVENGLMRASIFCSSMSFLSVKGQVVQDVRRPLCNSLPWDWAPEPPRDSKHVSPTVSAASGPGSSGRGPLKVSLDTGPAQSPLPLQNLQDITDRVHQVSHVALALGKKLQNTEGIRGDTDMGSPLPAKAFPWLALASGSGSWQFDWSVEL